MKKILILTERWYPDTFGGSERLALWQAQALQKNGYDITVFSTYYRKNLKRQERFQNIKIIRAGSSFSFPGSTLYSILFKSKKYLKQLLQKQTFDLVIIHHPLIGSIFFEQNIKIPALYIFHSSRPMEISFEGLTKPCLNNFLSKKIITAFTARKEKTTLLTSDKILYLSNFSKKILAEKYPEIKNKLQALAPGIPKDMFSANFNRDYSKNIFFTSRRLSPRTGVLNLIKATKILKDKNINFKVFLTGSGPLEKECHNLAAKLNIQDCLFFLGVISDQQLIKHYQTASCFVLPTLALEGVGISTLEALFSALPVIGTPIGATKEILTPINKELIMDSASPQAIADKMLWFINLDESTKKDLARKSRAYAENHFTAEIMNQELTATVQLMLATTKVKS
ncbi:MAG: glycosyltransferase family 4 protein [Patescibacteria group bacterium]